MPYRPPRVRPYVYDPTDDIARGFAGIERHQDRQRQARFEDLEYDVALAKALEAGLRPDEVERIRERVSGPGLGPDELPDRPIAYDPTGTPSDIAPEDESFAGAIGQIGGQMARDIETPGLPPGDVRAPLGTPGGGASGPLVGRTPQGGDDPSTPFDETQVGPVTTPGINPSAPSPQEMMRGGPVTRAPEPRQTPGIYDEFYRFPTGTEYRPPDGTTGDPLLDQLAGAFGGDRGMAALMADPNVPAAVKQAIYERSTGGGGPSQLTPEAVMEIAGRYGVELDPMTAQQLAQDPEGFRDWLFKRVSPEDEDGGGFATATERQDAAMQAADEYLQDNPGDFVGAARHAGSVVPNTAISAADVARATEQQRFQEENIDRRLGVPPNALAETARRAMIERGASPGDLRDIYRRKHERGEIDRRTWNELNAWLKGDLAPIKAFTEGMIEGSLYEQRP